MGQFIVSEEHYSLDNIDKIYRNGSIELEGHTLKRKSDRYENFIIHGFTCACCGLQGQYAKICLNNLEGYHLNVYGVNAEGKEVLLTKDHIFPRSRGGADIITNYQVLCNYCNSRKQDDTKITTLEALRKGYATCKSIERAVKLGHKKALQQ